MRVLRIYPFLPPLPGGMEKHIQRLTQEQRLLGCEVTVIFNRGSATATSDLTVLPSLNLRGIKPQLLRDLIFFCAAYLKILTSRHRADVIHVHGDWSAFLFGRFLCAAAGARVMVASIHGVARKKAWGWFYSRILSAYGVVYCTGAGDAAYLQQVGVVAARWQNSGIDEVFFHERPATLSEMAITDVVCVANFFPVKNMALAIDIARTMPNVKFVLIGDGPLRNSLEIFCNKHNISNVRFSGRLSTQEIVAQLNRARIFLATAYSEGTPTALLEAMACGLPIVTSQSNDYRDLIVNGRNGYVVDSFIANNYVEILRKLLADQSLRIEISARNRVEAKRHAWPVVARRITNWMRDECAL